MICSREEKSNFIKTKRYTY